MATKELPVSTPANQHRVFTKRTFLMQDDMHLTSRRMMDGNILERGGTVEFKAIWSSAPSDRLSLQFLQFQKFRRVHNRARWTRTTMSANTFVHKTVNFSCERNQYVLRNHTFSTLSSHSSVLNVWLWVLLEQQISKQNMYYTYEFKAHKIFFHKLSLLFYGLPCISDSPPMLWPWTGRSMMNDTVSSHLTWRGVLYFITDPILCLKIKSSW